MVVLYVYSRDWILCQVVIAPGHGRGNGLRDTGLSVEETEAAQTHGYSHDRVRQAAAGQDQQ